jgi:hypothetical protein
MLDSWLPPVVGGLMSCLRYLCLFAVSSVHHILCCVVFLFCVYRLVFPMLPVSLDCPFLIVLSVFSNVYLHSLCSSVDTLFGEVA